ncbi:MAG: hypothetical protein ABI743_00810 [bacterium]
MLLHHSTLRVVASILFVMSVSGCYQSPLSRRYGPKLADAAKQAYTQEPADPNQATASEKAPTHAGPAVHFLNDLNVALNDAADRPGYQKIALLLTDGRCADCVKYETVYFVDGAVQKAATEGWILVRGDVTRQKSLLDRFGVGPSDLPVVVLLSEGGVESGRLTKLPASPAAFARILDENL